LAANLLFTGTYVVWNGGAIAFASTVKKKVGSTGGEDDLAVHSSDTAWKSFRRAERREWWLWLAAIMVTLLLTVP
jgi:hypothetical protein